MDGGELVGLEGDHGQFGKSGDDGGYRFEVVLHAKQDFEVGEKRGEEGRQGGFVEVGLEEIKLGQVHSEGKIGHTLVEERWRFLGQAQQLNHFFPFKILFARPFFCPRFLIYCHD